MKATRIVYYLNGIRQRLDLNDEDAVKIRVYLKQLSDIARDERTAEGRMHSMDLNISQRSEHLVKILRERYGIEPDPSKRCAITRFDRNLNGRCRC